MIKEPRRAVHLLVKEIDALWDFLRFEVEGIVDRADQSPRDWENLGSALRIREGLLLLLMPCVTGPDDDEVWIRDQILESVEGSTGRRAVQVQ